MFPHRTHRKCIDWRTDNTPTHIKETDTTPPPVCPLLVPLCFSLNRAKVGINIFWGVGAAGRIVGRRRYGYYAPVSIVVGTFCLAG